MFNPNPMYLIGKGAKGPIGRNPRKLTTYAMDERTPTGEITIYAHDRVPPNHQMMWHKGLLIGVANTLTETVPPELLRQGFPMPDAITFHPSTYEAVLASYLDQRQRYKHGAPHTVATWFKDEIAKARRWLHRNNRTLH